MSTIEVLNILLGEGNDRLTIRSTLVPGADTAEDDKLPAGIPALHGGLTTVHGGGNALLAVTGTFTVTTVGGVGRVTRTDGARLDHRRLRRRQPRQPAGVCRGRLHRHRLRRRRGDAPAQCCSAPARLPTTT